MDEPRERTPLKAELMETNSFVKPGKVEWSGTDGSLIARAKRVWSCPFHDREQTTWEYCDCDSCEGHEVSTCEYCAEALWVYAVDDEGEIIYEIVFEEGLDRILRRLYLPPIIEVMNQNILLSAIAEQDAQNTDRTQIVPVSLGT